MYPLYYIQLGVVRSTVNLRACSGAAVTAPLAPTAPVASDERSGPVITRTRWIFCSKSPLRPRGRRGRPPVPGRSLVDLVSAPRRDASLWAGVVAEREDAALAAAKRQSAFVPHGRPLIGWAPFVVFFFCGGRGPISAAGLPPKRIAPRNAAVLPASVFFPQPETAAASPLHGPRPRRSRAAKSLAPS